MPTRSPPLASPPIARLAAALVPEDPSLAAEVAEAATSPKSYFERNRDTLRDWGVASAKGRLVPAALFVALARRRQLGLIDADAPARGARAEVERLLRSFEPVRARPKLPRAASDVEATLRAMGDAVAPSGLALVALTSDGEHRFVVLVPAAQVGAVTRAGHDVERLALEVYGKRPRRAAAALKRRMPPADADALGPTREEKAAAERELVEAAALATDGAAPADVLHAIAAFAWLTLGDDDEARHHMKALAAHWSRMKTVQFDDYSFGQLALVSLVDRRPIRKLVDRVAALPEHTPYAATAVRLLAGAPPYPDVDPKACAAAEKRVARVVAAAARGERKALIDAFVEFVETRKTHRPSVLLTALALTRGLDAASFPAAVRGQLCKGFLRTR